MEHRAQLNFFYRIDSMHVLLTYLPNESKAVIVLTYCYKKTSKPPKYNCKIWMKKTGKKINEKKK